MSQHEGIRNAVLGSAAMYLHQSRDSADAGRDALIYYGKGVRGIQESLAAVVGPAEDLDPVVLLGVMLLMTYEMLNGSAGSYYSHLQALSQLIHNIGATRCRSGIYSIIFRSVALANINNAFLRETDTFLASEEWCLTIEAAFPVRWSHVLVLYAKAARTVYIHLACKRNLLSYDPDLYQANQRFGMTTLSSLRAVLDYYSASNLPSVVENAPYNEILGESPFQPCLTLPNLWVAANFPTLVANILTLETAFEIENKNQFLLVHQIVQVSQQIIVHATESAALLQQIWPLIVARRYLTDTSHQWWLNKIECIIRVKGFGLATDYRS